MSESDPWDILFDCLWDAAVHNWLLHFAHKIHSQCITVYIAKVVESNDMTDGDYPALGWEDRHGLAFTKGDLSYQNKFLLIPQTGFYFVYSQVLFRGLENQRCEKIIHIVTKLTPSYPEPMKLLSSTQTISEKSDYKWSVPIYLGAMIQLEKGDRLMVNVSSVALVDHTNEHKTFFGAFLL
uniref:TNF superfamily member 15 n=1 Tax=Callorhinchus milii TaxID=7868 RepID=A0A4W3HHV6_CALMI